MNQQELQQQWAEIDRKLTAIEQTEPKWIFMLAECRKFIAELIAQAQQQSIVIAAKDRRIARLEQQVGQLYAALETAKSIDQAVKPEPQLPRFRGDRLSSFRLGK